MPDEYDPNSITATLATIIAKQEAMRDMLVERSDRQDATLARIEAQANRTNGRVTKLEMNGAKLAGIALALGAVGSFLGWAIQTWASTH